MLATTYYNRFFIVFKVFAIIVTEVYHVLESINQIMLNIRIYASEINILFKVCYDMKL